MTAQVHALLPLPISCSFFGLSRIEGANTLLLITDSPASWFSYS